VEAHIYPHNIPARLVNRRVETKILNPVVKILKQDVESIEDLLGDLRKLARANKVHNKMFYTRNINGDKFDVYDYALEKKFDMLHQLAEIPKEMLTKDYESLYKLAECITPRKENKSVACVRGSTLREATERALRLYDGDIDAEIDKIDELFRKNK
jgi:hypothetical protein